MVWCVVLNWNGADDTLACLEALRRQTVPLHVAVVDNASTDGSAERLQAWIGEHTASSAVSFTFLQSAINGGFAAGNNLGIRRALADSQTTFVWLLNNDTVAPPDTLARLLAAAAAEPRAGIVGSVLLYTHAPDTVQAWGGGRLRPAIAHSTHFTSAAEAASAGWDDPRTYATFASVLLRRQALEDAGLLDEGFFMYYEDADLNLRMRRAGWGVTVAADTRILHREGGSRQRRKSAWTEEQTTRSALRFVGKHAQHPRAGMFGFLLLRAGKRLLGGHVGSLLAVWRGLRHHVKTARAQREPLSGVDDTSLRD